MAVYTTIDNPELYFQVKIYTGDASTQAVTLDGDEDMQPNFVWIKNRATTGYNTLFDSVRGVEKPLWSNATSSEGSDSNTLTAFGSDGFTVGSDAAVNGSGNSLVAYCWKESADAGFDIVTYTGNETARTISHSLSAKPRVIICKGRSVASNWTTQHGSYGAEKQFQLQETDAVADHATTWNDTEPTTSVFSVGTGTACNDNGETFVAYLFAEKQGFSKFGSYVGNANTDGTFIYTGFSPAWILHKRASDTGDWRVWNNKSEGFNPNPHALFPNTDATEYNTSNLHIDFLSNGFKFRTSDSNVNTSGETYIYMAFAEAPFVNSNGVPCNAR
jgi:hypothetical protein